MIVILFLSSATIVYCTCTYLSDNEEVYHRYLREDNELNLNESFFPPLPNYRVGGVILEENEYPWIAKVIHSSTNPGPYLCTAACIRDNIFISAARCVYLLKVIITSLQYQHFRLSVKALVMPSKTTKQLYDDVGFIITKDEYDGEMDTIQVYDKKRTDNVFRWFQELKFDEFEHKVIGYAPLKSIEPLPIWHENLNLVEMDVAVGIELCSKILSYNNLINGFPVPCYHSCTLTMYRDGNATCQNYLGVTGAALVNKESNVLFGIATWGATSNKCILPVGFSVTNSDSFYEDLECALKIQNNTENATAGFYQSLCDNKRRYYLS